MSATFFFFPHSSLSIPLFNIPSSPSLSCSRLLLTVAIEQTREPAARSEHNTFQTFSSTVHHSYCLYLFFLFQIFQIRRQFKVRMAPSCLTSHDWCRHHLPFIYKHSTCLPACLPAFLPASGYV
jgi:hypothetical protein